MLYSWGLFWPRELGVLNQRRISPSLHRPWGKTGRRANEISDLDRITTSVRAKEQMISLTCSAFTHLTIIILFSRPLRSCARLWGCMLMPVFNYRTALNEMLPFKMYTCTVSCRRALKTVLAIWIGLELCWESVSCASQRKLYSFRVWMRERERKAVLAVSQESPLLLETKTTQLFHTASQLNSQPVLQLIW